ncbi:GNAT family N-acetyltransferase [Shewanella saliphila]|uniref:N-acetyltransferase n=1 Tax=Shewanella saliphila TaxID=2282698 RepID=A0ABQ2Q1A3_9GAMM|nr:GNAT family protein [Shewanella saliphila]MCL1100170.1 GNAT family N-acetyltransferase [Shewanella saliphila]GGP38956.1 N-acetyltransferase [Shewanella saliphila]
MEDGIIFPVLSSQRLTLNAINEADRQAIFGLFSNSNVVKYYDLDAFEHISQADEIIAFFNTRFEQAVGIRWAIRLKETGELIGTCGFNSWSEKMKTAVIGYDLNHRYWGQSYTTEAIQLIIKAAFEGVLSCGAINRIQADTVLGNKASEAVLKKLGFCEEGIRRQSGFWTGQFHDLTCFGLLKSEYCEI